MCPLAPRFLALESFLGLGFVLVALASAAAVVSSLVTESPMPRMSAKGRRSDRSSGSACSNIETADWTRSTAADRVRLSQMPIPRNLRGSWAPSRRFLILSVTLEPRMPSCVSRSPTCCAMDIKKVSESASLSNRTPQLTSAPTLFRSVPAPVDGVTTRSSMPNAKS